MRHLQYLSYVLRHKWFVLVAGLRIGAPLWRLLIHDWSKFLPSEWGPYATYFYAPKVEPVYGDMRNVFPHLYPANCARINANREAAFDGAWLKHQHRAPHHWQHWVLREDSGATKLIAMPRHLAREMVADWMGAGRAITGKWEAASWYAQNRDKIQLHSDTRVYVEALLSALPDHKGEPNG